MNISSTRSNSLQFGATTVYNPTDPYNRNKTIPLTVKLEADQFNTLQTGQQQLTAAMTELTAQLKKRQF